jgi:hypothetical protein
MSERLTKGPLIVEALGLLHFDMIAPVEVDDNMRFDPELQARISSEIDEVLLKLDVKSLVSTSRSFRPREGGGLELYRFTVTVPGTVSLRQQKRGPGRPRKRKK